MTPTAAFAQTPKTADAVVTAALANLGTDAPTGLQLLMTAGANGNIVTRLSAAPRATVTATSLVLFISRDNGVTLRLKDSATMAAQTLSTTAGITPTPFTNYSESRPMRLGAGDKLYVGSQVALAAGIVFSAEYTDF